MIDTGLHRKVVLVTGANHGIGAATAKAFAAQGAAVFISYLRHSPETFGMNSAEAQRATVPGEAFYRAQQTLSADHVLHAIHTAGGRAEAAEADLAQPALIPHLFDQVEAVFGLVDILVNNAAYGAPDTLLPQTVLPLDARAAGGLRLHTTVSSDSHDRHFAVNSRAVVLMMAEYARRHIERKAMWGRIINVSTDGASCFPGTMSYGASKHAMESYSRAAAVDLGPYNVTVNIVSLGPVQTGWIPPEQEQTASGIPLGRVGQPEDVADVIVFFASEQARWVTGQLLYVGGGHMLPL